MTEDLPGELARIEAHPRYHELVRKRSRFAWALSAIMLAAYVGFLLLVAFDKPFLAQSIGGGVTSLGILIGIGLILLAIALTAIYVRRANREFDALLAEVLAR